MSVSISLITTVVLAFVGYIVTYFNKVRLENRKFRLKYISDQIQFLYGPLFSLSNTADEAWQSFRSRCRPTGSFFGSSPPPTEDELQQWRLWMTEVFMPLNLRMEKAIVENAHLIEGDGMPEEFQGLLAHVEVYRIVLKKWLEQDYLEHTAYIDFPANLRSYVETQFSALKKNQNRIIKSIL
jgi:hypothetical protein